MLGRTSGDYPGLNSWAHRKETARFTAPAVTLHLAFWHREADDRVQTGPARNEMRQRLDGLVGLLYRHCAGQGSALSGVSLYPLSGRDVLLFDGTYTTLDADPYLRAAAADATSPSPPGSRSTYRIVFLTGAWNGFRITFRFEFLTEYWTLTIVASATRDASLQAHRDMHAAFNRLVTRELNPLSDDEKSRLQQQADALRDYFYRNFWKAFLEEVIPQAFRDDELLDHVFADFRGIIISDETMVADLQLAGSDGHNRTVLEWGRESAERLMPIINDASEKHECTASYMLDGRVLYMTTLGPQAFSAASDDRIPVRYIGYVHQRIPDGVVDLLAPPGGAAGDEPAHRRERRTRLVNKWQVGRLITRIHLLGTVRLAALRKLDELYNSGQVLGELEPIIKAAREKITDEFNAGKVAEAIKSANRKFNEINGIDILIQYRIERSRYYMSQFRQNVPALRLHRVEGYQPYDEFIFRRAGATYDFIDRLGRRYERATQNLALLDQYFLSISANRIARIGELILIVILVPYYMTSLLVHMRADEKVGSWGYLLFLIFGAYGFWRFFEMGEGISKFEANRGLDVTRGAERDAQDQEVRTARRNVIRGALSIVTLCVAAYVVSMLPAELSLSAVAEWVRTAGNWLRDH